MSLNILGVANLGLLKTLFFDLVTALRENFPTCNLEHGAGVKELNKVHVNNVQKVETVSLSY